MITFDQKPRFATVDSPMKLRAIESLRRNPFGDFNVQPTDEQVEFIERQARAAFERRLILELGFDVATTADRITVRFENVSLPTIVDCEIVEEPFKIWWSYPLTGDWSDPMLGKFLLSLPSGECVAFFDLRQLGDLILAFESGNEFFDCFHEFYGPAGIAYNGKGKHVAPYEMSPYLREHPEGLILCRVEERNDRCDLNWFSNSTEPIEAGAYNGSAHQEAA